MNNKAQTAIEYLLILGAVILVVAIVVAIIGELTKTTGNAANKELCSWLQNLFGSC